jgi:DNA-binding NarL/FixJ family response regulator
MEKITILIVDDHPLMREALAIALQEEPDLEVIAEASDGISGVEMFQQLNPDVVLMDLLLPGLNGLGAISQIIASHPRAKILVLSSLEDEENILAAVQAGALGYFPKTAPRVYLMEAIRKVADGVPYLPAGIAAKLFKSLREMKTPAIEDQSNEKLTPRQQQILHLMGEGRTDDKIAQTLHITETTVRAHIHNILQRLNLENRSQAVAYANHQRDNQ